MSAREAIDHGSFDGNRNAVCLLTPSFLIRDLVLSHWQRDHDLWVDLPP